jgi:hypothetical protein
LVFKILAVEVVFATAPAVVPIAPASRVRDRGAAREGRAGEDDRGQLKHLDGAARELFDGLWK